MDDRDEVAARGPAWPWITTTVGALAGAALYTLWTFSSGAAADHAVAEPLVLVMSYMFGTLLGGVVALIGSSVGGAVESLAPVPVVLVSVLVSTALAALLVAMFAAVATWGERLVWIGGMGAVVTVAALVAIVAGRASARRAYT